MAAINIYIMIWLEHHQNRPYVVMGLWSKMCEWMNGWMEWVDIPQTVMTTKAPALLTIKLFQTWV